MAIDRSVGPLIHPIQTVQFPEVETYTLDNGIVVTEVGNCPQDILQIQLFNRAGRVQEDQKLTSRVAASMLRDGAGSLKGDQIAERIDYYGASLSTGANMDVAYGTLFTLTQYQEEVLPILADVWLNPHFPEADFLKFKQNQIQKLREDLTKSETVSYRIITDLIFGEHHPYGYNSTEALFKNLAIDDVKSHYDRHFGHNHTSILVTGKTTDSTRSLINKYFGTWTKETPLKPYILGKFSDASVPYRESVASDYQSAIKIGRPMFSRMHEDFAGMFVLNVILGGYFGSRLMSSIREENGYTYNIYSALSTLRHSGFFYISTETAHEYVEPTLAEIYTQIQMLQEDLIDLDEMEMARNYIMGNFLGMLDGPFNTAQMVKTFIINGLPADHFESLRDTVLSITPDQLRQLARKYLNREDLIELVVS